jgi:hypothetical protein
MGLIARDTGRQEKYLEELQHAVTYAWNEHLDAIARQIVAHLP